MISTLSEALAERGYDSLTDVQAAVTAPELEGADLLVSAQTGSGKTVAFGLAIASDLLGEDPRLGAPAAPLALAVAPTRELAMQVANELGWLYGKAGARIATCIGGMDARNERRALERGAHIVVGTPGRLRDHIERGALELTDIRAVVLDEADEMLDLGFREDLEAILASAPEERRTLLFSATVPPAIAELAKHFQRDAQRISTVGSGRQHSDIEYQAVQVAKRDEERAIINLLRYHDAGTAIVFANTRAAVARLAARIGNRGFATVSLSGELNQDARSHALQSLRDGRARVCVATDVAARGIDLPNLELVIHADLPTNTEALLHRSGRTGRAGRKGISALIVTDPAVKKAQRLLKWAKIEASWIPAPTADDVAERDRTRLLEAPVWTDAPEEEETAFSAELMERFTPEQIAVACLRLYRTQLSAPEELNEAPVTPREKGPRADFGPARWISLSVGREGRAEPRWLLPLMLRAGNIEKAQLGKIRIQDNETWVEIAEAAVEPFMGNLGDDGLLEDGIKATLMEGEPDLSQRPSSGGHSGGKPRGDFGDRPRRDRDERAPRRDRDDYGSRPERSPRSYDSSKVDRAQYDRAPRKDHDGAVSSYRGKPEREGGFDKKPYDKKPRDKSWGDKPRSDKPRGEKSWGDKPRSDKPRGEKSWGDKPRSDKPRGEKSWGDRKPYDKKPYDKASRDGGDKPRRAPFREGAGDASQSLRARKAGPGRPGGPKGGKPRAGRPAGWKGDAPPRRKD